MTVPVRVLYCHCAYAQVVPKEVKAAVLERLCLAGIPFEAVPDLCEMSARQDPTLRGWVAGGPVRIAACYPRAVQWLFNAAQAPLALERTELLNMRQLKADEVMTALLCPEFKPNLADTPTPFPVTEGDTAAQHP